MGRILIDRDLVVAEMHFLEPVCPKFLDSLPTESRSVLLHINPIFREVRGHGSGIVLVECIGVRLNASDKPFT